MALSIHVDYACRKTGVCCSSGWPIPVERVPLEALESALRDGRLDLKRTEARSAPSARLLPRRGPLPEGAGARLGHDAVGRCLLLETRGSGLCSVHRQLGTGALPTACRQFPRLCVIEAQRISVSLSHYCPTAAALLLEERTVERVEAAAASVDSQSWEGLDARALGARLLRPGVLLDPEAYDEWERGGLELLGSGADPDHSVARLTAAAESARRWKASEGGLAGRVRDAFAAASLAGPDWPARLASARRVRRAAPVAWRPAAAWPRADAFERWVRPAWQGEARLVGRYLCARFFACWALFLGAGLRSHAAWMRLALDTLAVEAARRGQVAGAELDTKGLVEAIRETDRRLLHLAHRERLVEGLEENARSADRASKRKG